MQIDISIKDAAWCNSFTDLPGFAKIALQPALRRVPPPEGAELSLAFISDDEMQGLNRDYRAIDMPTNVLSFPAVSLPGPGVAWIGDIVLARETVLREAAQKNISAQDHLAHLLIHGYLHLRGYDHAQPKEAAQMESLEIAILAELDIDDPYSDHKGGINQKFSDTL